jgi:hypothetical protein
MSDDDETARARSQLAARERALDAGPETDARRLAWKAYRRRSNRHPKPRLNKRDGHTSYINAGATASTLPKALLPFEKAQLGFTHLRDLHQHMDDVMKGKAGAYGKLPDPDLESVVYDDEGGDLNYLVGGRIFRLDPIARDVIRLADELRNCYP